MNVPFTMKLTYRRRWTIGAGVVTTVFALLRLRSRNYMPTMPQPPTAADIDWSRFAYTLYATDSEYLCNSVMILEALHRLSSRADRLIMYRSEMFRLENAGSSDARLLIKARDEYDAKLVPVPVLHRRGADSTWADSYTKLHAFNQTQYRRILFMDSDSVMLKHMDELFFLPSSPAAMPRAYWLLPGSEILSSHLMLIEPSRAEFARVMERVGLATSNEYDMEIVNYLYRKNSIVLPHRPYGMLTGEFRNENHTLYLGSDREPWDAIAAYHEAKFIHFSDWPIPKPWLHIPEKLRLEMQPRCIMTWDGAEDCTSKDVWNLLYSSFRTKRKVTKKPYEPFSSML
ncbi:hypothetical protein MRS44_003910 [Fusarium solani]|uniref:uncharacterized protein n=1 Tax=Fusarium solani TaxID=169388 RepID=UPI0032C3F5E3|nr:hypothetical protein MRS44_003828 [Fusarium solani]KAJ3469845.1 hypothetical protein MRS44_003910 [Fusarium solani]